VELLEALLVRARSAMTALMSISLNVVRIAAVCCACTSRSAMRLRMRVHGDALLASLGWPWGAVAGARAAGAADAGRRAVLDVRDHVLFRQAAAAAVP
jgi:hypothetical protein